MFAALLLAGTLGRTCGPDTEPSGSLARTVERAHDAEVCVGYCHRASVCEEHVQIDACVSDCQASLSSCSEPQRKLAVRAIDECSMDHCSEFLACTIDAGLQCANGN